MPSAIGIVFSLAGTALKVIGAKKEAQAQKKAAGAAQARADREAAQQRLIQIRKARQERGRIAAQGESAGVDPAASSLVTGQSGVQAQLSGNLAFIESDIGLAGQVSKANQKALKARQLQGLGQEVQGFGGSISGLGDA